MLAAWARTSHAQFTRFQNYTDEQGLGNLTVTAIAQDKNGYMLLGTQGGLFRFDGAGFRQDFTGLPADWIVQIATDDAGRVWIVTVEGGIFVGRGARFDKVGAIRPGLQLAFFPHVLALDAGSVVVDADGLLRRAPIGPHGTGPFAPLFDAASLAANPVLAQAHFVVADADGGLLIGCGVALCHVADGHVTFFGTRDGLPDAAWEVALRTPDGTLWARSLDRLAWRRPGRATFDIVTVPGRHTTFFAAHPKDLALVADGRHGVLTQGDEGLLDWDGSSWRPCPPRTQGLPSAAVTTMMRDREGSLWSGSEGSGAFRDIGLGVWEQWTKEDGLPSDLVWGMIRLPDGKFWVSTDNGTVPLGGGPGGFPGLNYGLAASRAGRLWAAPSTGPLVRIGDDGRTTENFPSIGHVFAAAIDHANRLWLTTETGLFVATDADAPAPDIHVRLALPNPRCPLSVDRTGAVWAACREGVFRRDLGAAFRRVIAPGLLADLPSDMAFTSAGDLWIGTQANGILRFHMAGGQVEPLPSILPRLIGSHTILFLHRDRRGWMWVGTDHGIDMFDGLSWRHFDKSDGPVSNDTDEGSVYEDTDGSMWFGTSHGMSHLLDPAHLRSPEPLHPLIAGVSLGDRSLDAESPIRAGWTPNPLVIRFVDLDYARGNGIVFRYRLQGVDPSWNETTAHEARYSALPAGKFRFALIAVDTIHGAVSEPVGFTIRIQAPWWRRWWFYGLCALADGATLAGAWRTRVRLLLRQRRRLEDVVSMRTAEIEQARGELQRLAMTDILTGLANRRSIMGALEAATVAASATGAPLAVILWDIDHFKTVNDRFGHLAGDAVLAEFGARLSATVAAPGMAGRYGGEEFLVVLPGPEDDAFRRAASIRGAIADAPYAFGDAAHTVTASGGVALLRPGDTTLSLLARADAALYQAKKKGRNRIERERPESAADTRTERRSHAPRAGRRVDLAAEALMLRDQPTDARGERCS